MCASASALLFAATVLAAPAPNLLARGTAGLDASVYDQGDGFYTAIFNETTAKMDVVYTPMAEFDTTALEAVPQLDTRNTHELGKRDTTCSGAVSFHTPDVDAANIELANNANGREYGYKEWGWVHKNDETSFFCNYAKNYLTYQLIIDMQTHVSRMCGGSQYYGYDHRRNGGGAKDLTVGRTWKGDHFCDGRMHS